ncbi:MAG: orotidine 5'-phosphate decarboxylase / HUMPS family protein [Fervidicoccaceae archaeon]
MRTTRLGTSLLRHGEAKNTRLIVAFDRVPGRFAESMSIEAVRRELLGLAEHAAAIKVGLPFMLSLGLEALTRLSRELKGRAYLLADLKLADVPHISRALSKLVCEVGFDGLIVHAFVGSDSLREAVAEARSLGSEVFAVVAMSNPGAEEAINKSFGTLVRLALESDVDGLVVPATFPVYIRRARELAPSKTILSPGVGAQGAPVGSAVRAGSDFEIVGRTVLESADPIETARRLREALPWRL